MGGYDRIYPLPSENPKQVRYNEIVKALYNNEADSQIRKVTTNNVPNEKKKDLNLPKPRPPPPPIAKVLEQFQ